jgi:dipeptidyl aminopeptidase/acylaminoacyl peptidase
VTRRLALATVLIALVSSLALDRTNAGPTNVAPTNAGPTTASSTITAPTNAAPTNAAPTVTEHALWYISDGLRIKARVFWPAGPGPFPGIVFGHGGVDGLSDSSIRRCRELAKAGFAVFAPSYRGEDGGQGTIEVAKGEVNDVLNGLEVFERDSRLDANRIAMMGTSHGALIGLLAVSRTEHFRALVFAYGVSDILAWWEYLVATNQVGTDALTKRVYGSGPTSRPESFRIRNGMNVLENINVPVLILQGELDTTVPPSQAQGLYDGLTRLEKWAQLEVYPNSEHGFLMVRETLLDRYGPKSVQVQESKAAFDHAIEFLRQAMP